MSYGTLDRLKKRYKYSRPYLRFRAWRNFDANERRSFAALRAEIDSFETRRLFAAGNDGLIYEGVYRKAPDQPCLLKVCINGRRLLGSFRRVQETLAESSEKLPFLCQVLDFGPSKSDPEYWYQIQQRIEGMLISQYLLLPLARRLEVYDPIGLSIDLIDQSQALGSMRIIAPNIDLENVVIRSDRSLAWIDLDPYELIEKGPMPLFPLRRLFRLINYVLCDFRTTWDRQIQKNSGGGDRHSLGTLMARLENSMLFGYDSPIKKRHRTDHLVRPDLCFDNLEEARELLVALDRTLHAAP